MNPDNLVIMKQQLYCCTNRHQCIVISDDGKLADVKIESALLELPEISE